MQDGVKRRSCGFGDVIKLLHITVLPCHHLSSKNTSPPLAKNCRIAVIYTKIYTKKKKKKVYRLLRKYKQICIVFWSPKGAFGYTRGR